MKSINIKYSNKNIIAQIIIFVLFTITNHRCEAYDTTTNIIVQKLCLEKNAVKVYLKRNHINKSFRAKIEEHTDERFRIANPNKKFRGGCTRTIFNFYRPSQRLILYVESKNYSMLYYEQGGHHLSKLITIYDKANGSIISLYLNEPAKTLEHIFKLLEENKYSITHT